MKIKGTHYRTIWLDNDDVAIIDQRALPFKLTICTLSSAEEVASAISEMQVRGAPLIGVAGAFGIYLAARELASRHKLVSPASYKLLAESSAKVLNARPTAVNLRWAVERQLALVKVGDSWSEVVKCLQIEAQQLADDDVAKCQAMGEFGFKIIGELARKKKGDRLNILTHCNAGWLATIDYGTATSPIYRAHRAGIPVHVWVDETRPRLQGAKLTAFELGEEGVPHTVIADNAGGHLMQHGQVDLCIVGTDRTTRTGEVANKIGTYLKALAAHHNQIPFYAAVPSSSIDWELRDGREIPIEIRSEHEVLFADGVLPNGELGEVRIAAPNSGGLNPGFDVTPGEFLTGSITERGVCAANETALLGLFPERRVE